MVAGLARRRGPHHVVHAKLVEGSGVQPNRSHNVTLGDESDEFIVGTDHRKPTDVVRHHLADRGIDVGTRRDRIHFRGLALE